jgi:LEA14-like dessication related protein
MIRASSGRLAMHRTFVFALAALALSGCSGVVDSIKSTFGSQPTASIEEVRFADFELRSVTLDFRVEVTNPYTFNLPVVGLDYALNTNAQPFLDGSMDVDENIPAQGVKMITLPLRIDLVGLLDTTKSIRPGQVLPYEAQLGLNVDIPGAGPMKLPLTRSGELPIPAPPEVSIASIDWESMSLSEVKGTLLLDVSNPNEFAFTLKSFDYDLSLAGYSVAQGEGARSKWLSAGHQGQVPVPITFSPGGMLGGTQVDYALTGKLDIETPYGVITAPFDQTGRASQTR